MSPGKREELVSKFIIRLAHATAIAGGIVLTALILMTCFSILGRTLSFLGFGPVPGDFEILEAGIAFVIFCFLPYCQIVSGHASVDLFTSMLGPKPNRYILAFWESVFALVLIFIAWRLFEGTMGKYRNGQTSMFIQFPIWWAYAASFVAACVAALTGIWSAWDRVQGAVDPKHVRPISAEIVH